MKSSISSAFAKSYEAYDNEGARLRLRLEGMGAENRSNRNRGCSLPHSLIHSLTHSLIKSVALSHSLTHSLTHPLTDALTQACTHA